MVVTVPLYCIFRQMGMEYISILLVTLFVIKSANTGRFY